MTSWPDTLRRPDTVRRYGLQIAIYLLVLKVILSTVWSYGDYFPPNYDVDFLRGRESYFVGSYGCAFYIHILCGPASLALGLLLLSDRFRRTKPQWHRWIGRFQVIQVLLAVAPSGLWMALYAQSGPIGSAGFATLALATMGCAVVGWRAAIARRFSDHQRRMQRLFVLLCSAVVIRMAGGLASVLGLPFIWFDPAAAWLSWLMPLLVFEAYGVLRRPR